MSVDSPMIVGMAAAGAAFIATAALVLCFCAQRRSAKRSANAKPGKVGHDNFDSKGRRIDYHGRTGTQADLRRSVLASPLHPEDKALVASGELTADKAKALRYRREKFFANEIKGAVHEGRLSRRIICAYAPPSLTTVPLTLLISVYVIQFYEKVGASLGLLAFFQALARGIDVLSDPTMSYLSDSLRIPCGRRRPFIFVGAPFYCIALICLLFPQPDLSEFATSAWFGVWYIGFFLMSTFCNIPYDALGPELTDNQLDRQKLFFTCTLYDGLGSLVAAMLPAMANMGVSNYRETWAEKKMDSCSAPVGPYGRIDASTAPGPWLLASDGRSRNPPSVRSWVGFLNATGSVANASVIKAFDATNCSVGSMTRALSGGSLNATDMDIWCECRAKVSVTHNLDTTRYAYFYTGAFFGMWAFISLWTLVYCVRERSQLPGAKVLPKPRPMLPSMLNTMSNKPFTMLLPAWVLDSLANAIIGSLLTFFVRYVVKPEFSVVKSWTGETFHCSPINPASINWRCDSGTVVSASVLALLMGALLFTPLWLQLSSCFGKNKIWLAWSFMNGVTFLCYAVVGAGDVELCILMSVFNGAPIGAKFLADAVMAEVIDYDEFLTGARNEATYTMFKGFLPKIAAIPASAVPIVLLSTFGHVKPIDNVLQPQPDSIVYFICIVIIWIPAGLSFAAFLVKLRYPLRTERHDELIAEGVAAHVLGHPGRDPCSGIMYQPVVMTEEERKLEDLLGTFPGRHVVERFQLERAWGNAHVSFLSRMQLVFAIIWFVVFALTTRYTAFLLMSTDPAHEQLQIIPVLSIVAVGLGITMLAFTSMRCAAARKIQSIELDDLTLEKLHKKYATLEAVRNFKSLKEQDKEIATRRDADAADGESAGLGGDVGVESKVENGPTDTNRLSPLSEGLTKEMTEESESASLSKHDSMTEVEDVNIEMTPPTG